MSLAVSRSKRPFFIMSWKKFGNKVKKFVHDTDKKWADGKINKWLSWEKQRHKYGLTRSMLFGGGQVANTANTHGIYGITGSIASKFANNK